MKYNAKSIIGLAVGVVGIAYGLFSQSRMNKLANKLNASISDLEKHIPVEVSKDIVNVAIDKAVEAEVFSVARKAALAASVEMSSSIRKEVIQAVNNEFTTLSEQVSNEISDQVAKIDKSVLTTKVTRKAEQKILEKFDDSLDGVLDKFNGELTNLSKIYASIADTMGKRDDVRSNYFKL